MSNESESKTTAKPQPVKPADPKPAAAQSAATAAKKDEPLALEERRYSYDELRRNASQLVPDQLIALLHDGRAHVRSNAVLGLAATGQAIPQLVPLLRDSESVPALAAAEAITRLGREIRPLIPQIVLAVDGT